MLLLLILALMGFVCDALDPYEILGLSKTASAAQISHAFRQLALKYHPDKSSEQNAKQKFEQIRQAYEILTQRRSMHSTLNFNQYQYQYSQQQAQWNNAGFFSFDHIFGSKTINMLSNSYMLITVVILTFAVLLIVIFIYCCSSRVRTEDKPWLVISLCIHPNADGKYEFVPARRSLREKNCDCEWFGSLDQFGGGLVVVDVGRGGVAEQAGLQKGDVIIHVNNQNVSRRTADEITTLIKATKTSLSLDVVRNSVPRCSPHKCALYLAKIRLQRPLSSDFGFRMLSHSLKAYVGYSGISKWEGLDYRIGGVVVSTVEPSSIAQQAGLEAQDIIVKVDEHDVSNDSASDIMKIAKERSHLDLTVLKRGRVLRPMCEIKQIMLSQSETCGLSWICAHSAGRPISYKTLALMCGGFLIENMQSTSQAKPGDVVVNISGHNVTQMSSQKLNELLTQRTQESLDQNVVLLVLRTIEP